MEWRASIQNCNNNLDHVRTVHIETQPTDVFDINTLSFIEDLLGPMVLTGESVNNGWTN